MFSGIILFFENKNKQNSFVYYNSIVVNNKSLLISFSNAHVERIFSEMKLIKNKLRNQMDINTLNNHLMVLLNGSDVKYFDFKKAYEHWANKKRIVVIN
jgi:hypothetical protein